MPSTRSTRNNDMSNVNEINDENDVIIANQQSWYTIENIKNYSYSAVKTTLSVSKIYLMWVLLHYIASHMYVYFCTPSTLTGFLLSPFIISAPHCMALRWVIHNGADVVNAMWIVLGTWTCSKILKPN